MSNFTLAHNFTAQWEGGLTDHPADPGGITNFGVSLRWLKSLGHELGDVDNDGDIDADDIRALTLQQAGELFKQKFWEVYSLSTLPQLTATIHYDCMVNTGPRQATLIAQRACNSIVGIYGEKLAVDGVLGPQTRKFLTVHATRALADTLIERRKGFYRDLVVKRPDLAPFERGWINRSNALRSYVAQYV